MRIDAPLRGSGMDKLSSLRKKTLPGIFFQISLSSSSGVISDADTLIAEVGGAQFTYLLGQILLMRREGESSAREG